MSANLDPEHIAVLTTTISQYVKGAEDHTIRERLLLAYMKKYGRISKNNSGTSMTWQVEYSQPQMRQLGDAGEMTFAQHTAHKQATLDWRGYVITHQMSERQRLMNRGPEALVNLYAEQTPKLIKKFNDGLAGQFYVDGNASGNENAIHGFDSCTTGANAAAGNLIATPNDSYAGLTTNLGTYGGSWTANRASTESPRYPNATLAKDWPYGSGSSEYDFWAPKLVNSTSTAWGTGSALFKDNCDRVIRRTNIWMRSTGGTGNAPTLFIFGPDMYADVEEFYAAKERIIVPHAETENLGFSGKSMQVNGTAVVFDFDCPASSGYAVKVSDIELCCLYGSMYDVKGPEFDIKTNAYLTRLGFFGNMKFNPKNIAKISALA